ncbi:MAG: HAMP domain-containing sensor histidine kinase [Bacteroidales bacterium]|nr:HAMP domain-containing sensor histidine kinase [Bacteroidales bacterium]
MILQQSLISMGKPCCIQRIDTLFQKEMIESLGFVPKYSIRFIDAKQKENAKGSKFIFFAKVTEKQYIEVVLNSPLGSILRQAQLILLTSILLVILIGVILVYQLRSMLREKQFVNFIQEYTHALTHELKTPISGIYMSASQLVSGLFEDKPEHRQRYYQMCKDQSQKLLTTVDRILLVAKAEHSKITPSLAKMELKPYIDKIVDNRRQNNFRMKSVELYTEYQSETMTATIDPFLMENVLNNLIDNAIKYSDNTVKIIVSCAFSDKKLRINVKDNGFGIAEKDQKHIFDNFERGDKVEGKGIDGFGIGLNYVNKVIKAHKGTISVKSEEGLGSEFIIVLPNNFER